MDPGEYFERIGWNGPRTATAETLAGVLAAHMKAIPFENLDVLLGRPPKLDIASLWGKLVERKRGGYCYEHATLFAAVLELLGFVVHRHSARVVIVTPRELAPRTHMFLTVGDVMLDPGFGGLAPRVPVPLDGTVAGVHRLVRDGNDYALEYLGGERPMKLWFSSMERDLPIDFEMANHFTATWPQSPFVNRLMARAFTPDGRVTIVNRELTVYRGETSEARPLADRGELRALLREYFGFDLPEVETLRVPSIPEWS